MRPDGSEKQPIMQQLPRRFSSSYYGVRPFSWVRDRALLLATIPTEWGNELAAREFEQRFDSETPPRSAPS
jgi:hypothetical protein